MDPKFFVPILLFLLPSYMYAQDITYSNYEKEDTRDMNFEVIGKMNDNFLVYKNIRWKHKISIMGSDMQIKETVKLDFIPDKTFNVDFISYPNFFYIVYQYQKKNILYCMMAKMDAAGRTMIEPQLIDTTKIAVMADNKIYTTINSEDKQKIMVFKVHKKNDNYTIASLLYDSGFNLLHKHRQGIAMDDRRDNYDNFTVDNEGNFIFTKDSQRGNNENSSTLSLVTLAPTAEEFSYYNIDLQKYFIDEVRLKADNLNKKYIIYSFYSKKTRANIEGIFTSTWVTVNKLQTATVFIPLDDSVRNMARREGQLRFALDNFFIRQAVMKKDGGYLLIAEDFSTQVSNNGLYNNSMNRWDHLSNPYYYSSSSYYYYNRYYGYYRPLSSFNSSQSTRYYYNNILILSINTYGQQEWATVIQKDQYDDDNDNYLSYSTMLSPQGVHFLFNTNGKHQIVANQNISATGEIIRNATLKSRERGYEFMPRLSKQITTRQIIVPCTYNGRICFAKVDL